MAQSRCLFRETCGDAMALEHNGDVYSCDHYVVSANRLGNVLEDPLASLVSAPAHQGFGQAKRETLPGYCLSCAVRFACHGECPKNRFTKTPDGEPGLPASDVMAWARARDLGTVGRNDVCPCGSGRKFKRCCGET